MGFHGPIKYEYLDQVDFNNLKDAKINRVLRAGIGRDKVASTGTVIEYKRNELLTIKFVNWFATSVPLISLQLLLQKQFCTIPYILILILFQKYSNC
jgi:hypothetical protein